MQTVNTLVQLNPASLRRAAELMETLNEIQAEIDSLLGGQTVAPVKSATRVSVTSNGQKRHFSPEALEKIRAGQRKRWRNAKKAAAAATAGETAPVTATAIPATPAPAPVTTVPAAPAPAPAQTPASTPAPVKPSAPVPAATAPSPVKA